MKKLLFLALSAYAVKTHLNPNAAAKLSPVTHFEIGCRDLKKTTEFYTTVFGWSATDAQISSNLNTQSTEGIQGHITALGHEPFNYTTFYIQVDDVKEALANIEKAGGKKVVGPFPTPDKKQFAWFKDPEGNVLGLISK